MNQSALLIAAALAVMAAACSPAGDGPRGLPATSTTVAPATTTSTSTTTTSTSTTTTTTTTTTPIPTFPVMGTVVDPSGAPVSGVVVDLAGMAATTTDEGAFAFPAAPAGPIEVHRPAWQSATIQWDGEPVVELIIEPFVVRALRASKYVAADDAKFAALLELAKGSTVNSLVFDTKDESGFVLYETAVQEALDLDSVRPMYDPVARLAAAHDAGLYAITRLVTFEDAVWVAADPAVKLAGRWIDPRDSTNWEYPLALAIEACELGFDEIQFDYVRFPAGKTAAAFRATEPTTPEERVAAIEAFLEEAISRLHPIGCAVSVDVFAIVFSAPNDQGIGQRPEELSRQVDVISPMIYPSHYSPGWLGFDDPNAYPGAVVANALDDGGPRVAHPALVRPWLQAFFYDSDQILAGIAEAEARGHGWMLWNAGGEYAAGWLPPLETG